ncbi:putative exonuclease domain-containing protein [Symbiodinium microadriaticum]|uniref:Putative exonuclease domain-containing protein n=1 Tax=Symbiodinium microadriaticum TaxID=2951 RepID=A0A1Q9DQF3_SYMMI|nr:putative exonuclease domain-containing protein [Symbiodinium microadriaticum]
MSGKRAAVEVEADASVESLEHRAQTALAVPSRGRLLNSSGEVLDGAQTVTEAELRSGDVLTLHVMNQVQIKARKGGINSVFAAILRDGSVVGWGAYDNARESVRAPGQLRDVQQIQASDGAFAAILGDGSVVTWGPADNGGDSSAVQEQLRDVQQIQASDGAFAAILGDGSVVTWGYAAGFCRNRADETGACRNGLHSTEAALKAESDWIAAGPGPTTQATEAKRPILLVLDLEGGGNQDGRDGEDEIIEVPVLSMCPATGTELGRFHRFARPGFWVREAASMRQRFHVNCFNDGANSIPFPEVVEAMQQWLRDLLGLAPEEELRKESFLFVTCGNWDVKTAIPRQCNKPFPGAVDFGLQQLLFSRWTNIKEVFRDHFNLSDADAPTGMRGMLKRLRMPLAGQHHLGMDDVSNIAKILQRLIRDGCSIKATGQASLKVPGPMKGGFKGYGGFGKGKEKGKDKGKGGKGKDKKGKGFFSEMPPPQGAMPKSSMSVFMKGEKGPGGDMGEGKGAPSNGHVAPKAAATPAGTGQVVPPRSSAPWQWGTGLVSSAPTAEAAAEDEEMEPKKELEAFLQSAPLPGETWEEEEEPAQAGEEEAPLRKPNKQLEAFLNGAAMPGSDDEDDTELFKAHEFQGEPTPTPEPFAASKPRARPGEDWLDMDEAESTRFPAPKRPAPKMEGHIGPVASLSEILGEADEAEDEGVLLEPAAKAPRPSPGCYSYDFGTDCKPPRVIASTESDMIGKPGS